VGWRCQKCINSFQTTGLVQWQVFCHS